MDGGGVGGGVGGYTGQSECPGAPKGARGGGGGRHSQMQAALLDERLEKDKGVATSGGWMLGANLFPSET